jgi:hypothetical protein
MPELTSEIAWAIRDARMAGRIYSELAPQAGKPFVITSIGFSLHGVVDHALMRMAAIMGDATRVDRHAEAALALCARLSARPIAASIAYDWALLRGERGGASDLQRGQQLAAGARETAEELGMQDLARACHELESRLARDATKASERLAAPPEASEGSSAPLRFERDGEYWTLSRGGIVLRVRDTRGMQMLAQLIENAGRELHVLELSGAHEAVDGGDAGVVLDQQAKDAYAARLRELDAALDEASSWNDLGRREQLLSESELLRREISRAFGKGGRERRSASVVERARVNVRRRLTLAVRRIEQLRPELGQELWASLKTGVYCVYQAPD